MFEHIIGPNGLLRNKTRILVTHGVGYLPQTDLIVVLSSGTISEVGTYDQLMENNGAFAEFLHTYQMDEAQESIEQEQGEQSSKSIISILRRIITNCDF
jgi:butyrate kinase